MNPARMGCVRVEGRFTSMEVQVHISEGACTRVRGPSDAVTAFA